MVSGQPDVEEVLTLLPGGAGGGQVVLDMDEEEENDPRRKIAYTRQITRDVEARADEMTCEDATLDDTVKVTQGKRRQCKNSKRLGNGGKKTEMHEAAEKGDVEKLQQLVSQHPEDVLTVNQEGNTSLHLAAKALHLQCCQVLLQTDKKQAIINTRTNNGNSPLSLSITAGKDSTKVSQLLLDHGAKITNINKAKQTVLHLAAECGNLYTVQLLLDSHKGLLEEKDKQNQSALHLAAKSGHWLVLRKLVEAGANPEDKDSHGYTPLHWAASMGFTKCCTSLLELHADVNAVDSKGNTPLHLFCAKWRGDFKCLTVLLQHQADVNAQNTQHETPLHFCSRLPIEMIQTLKQDARNIDLNIQDKKGRTALHYAAERRNPEYVEQILSINTITKKIINYKDGKGMTALHIAITKNAQDSCHLLLRAGSYTNQDCEVGSILHLVALHGLVGVGEHLLNKRAKSTKNSQGQTPLHLAAGNGHSRFCQMLDKKVPTMCVTDENGRNALHYASNSKLAIQQTQFNKSENTCIREARVACCRTLVEIQPKLVNKQDNTGRTPLHMAVEARSLKCCQALLTVNTNVWVRGNGGESAVMQAYKQNSQDIFTLLLQHQQKEGYTSTPDVDFRDILKEALQDKKREVAAAIVNSEYWESSLKPFDPPENTSSKKMEEEQERNNNLKQLVEVYPELAETVFDKCCSTTTDEHNHEEKYTFLVRYLDPLYTTNGMRLRGDPAWRQNHPIPCAIRHRRHDLLAHPLVTHLCHYKWKHYIKMLHYARLILSLCMALLLTSYTYLSWDWTYLYAYKKMNQSLVCPVGERMVGPEVEPFLREQGLVAHILGYAVFAQILAVLLFYLYKMIKLSLHYLRIDDLASVVLWILSFLFVMNFTHCSKVTYIREDWQWVPGGLAVVLAWIKVFMVDNWFNPFTFRFHQLFRVLVKMVVPLFVIIVIFIVFGVVNKGRLSYNWIWIDIFSHQVVINSVILGIFVVVCLSMMDMGEEKNRRIIHELNRKAAYVTEILIYDQLYPCLRRRFHTEEIIERREEDTRCCVLPCRCRHTRGKSNIRGTQDENEGLCERTDQQHDKVEKMKRDIRSCQEIIKQEIRKFQEQLIQERVEFQEELKKVRREFQEKMKRLLSSVST